jgi:S1-C subfamily serine protease
LNTKGELIGIHCASCQKSSTAIPVDTVRRSIQQIIQYGVAFTPKVGVIIDDDARLCGVVSGSSAANMGLGAFTGTKTNVTSRIVKADGKAIRNRGDLESLLDSKDLGRTVHLTIKVAAKLGKEANSRLLTVPLTVRARSNQTLYDMIGQNFNLWDC